MSDWQVWHGHAPKPPPGFESLTVGETTFCWRGDDVQPFRSRDGRCVGLLAGELWRPPGAVAERPPRSLGDHIQTAYRRDGASRPFDLDGAFSLVFRDGDNLVSIRDPIGERPVYIADWPGATGFCDRLAPLLAHPNATREIDPGGVSDYLACGFCPFERTPARGISKLLGGEAWRLRDGHSAERCHTHTLYDEPETTDPRTLQNELRRATLDAVDKRLANAPAVLTLSGGFDSSLVGALVQQHAQRRAAPGLEACVSLSFGAEYRNELEFSALMAQSLGVPHHVVEVGARDVIEHFAHTATVLDEPIGDPLTVPNVIVARAARRYADVVFNGEGGDPLFGGPKNLPLMVHHAYGGEASEDARADLYLASYNKGYNLLPSLYRDRFRRALEDQPSTRALLKPWLASTAMRRTLNTYMHVNLRLKGGQQILPKVFKAGAAAGLKVRSPLFDRRLAELSFALPPELKLKGSVEKYLLKEAFRDELPRAIVERPKSGMLVPAHHWFRGPLERFARRQLLGSKTRLRAGLEPRALKALLAYRGGGVRGFYGDRIWLLLSLEHWLRVHDIGWP